MDLKKFFHLDKGSSERGEVKKEVGKIEVTRPELGDAKDRQMHREKVAGEVMATYKEALVEYEDKDLEATLGDLYGNLSPAEVEEVLGISRDEGGRYRLRNPGNENIPGSWIKEDHLKAFVVSFNKAEETEDKLRVLAKLYEYIGLPFQAEFAVDSDAKNSAEPIIPEVPEPITVPETEVAVAPDVLVVPPMFGSEEGGVSNIPEAVVVSEDEVTVVPEVKVIPSDFGLEKRSGADKQEEKKKERIAGTPLSRLASKFRSLRLPIALGLLLLASGEREFGPGEARASTLTSEITEGEGEVEVEKPAEARTMEAAPESHLYTLKSGDRPWNLVHDILEARVGGKVSNADVMTATKLVCESNGIRDEGVGADDGMFDARLLKPGMTIDLTSAHNFAEALAGVR